jgi:hypothetical protein
MGDFVSDGESFSCPFCTAKVKLGVSSSPMTGDGKKIANTSNFSLSAEPGAQCLFIPSAPAPCQPSGKNIYPGQSPLSIDGSTALGAGCKFICTTKPGILTVSASAQSCAHHDGAASAEVLAIAAIAASKDEKPDDKKDQNKKDQEASSPTNKKSSRPKKGSVDPNLPKDPFKDPNFEDVSHPQAAKNGHYEFKNKKTGEYVKFDKGKPGAMGHEGKDHYHKLNPASSSKKDLYLDGKGQPVAKNSDASHVYPPD